MKTVRITNDTGLPHDTKVVDAETGHPIGGITDVSMSISARGPVLADLYLSFVTVDMTASARFLIADPNGGDHRPVRSVTFDDDGEVRELAGGPADGAPGRPAGAG